jgi:hypothetical protein
VAGHMCRPHLTPFWLFKSSPPLVIALKLLRYLKAWAFVALEIAAHFLRSPAPLVTSHIKPHTDRPTNHSAIASHLERPNHLPLLPFTAQTAYCEHISTCVSSKSSKKKSTSCPTGSSTAGTIGAAHRESLSAGTRAPKSCTTLRAHQHPMSPARQHLTQCPHLNPHPSHSHHRSRSPSSCNHLQHPCPHLLHRLVTSLATTATPLPRATTAARITSKSRRARA